MALKLWLSVFGLFLLLHMSASALGSLRGEAGVTVGTLVLAGCLVAQRLVFGEAFRRAAAALGLGRPTAVSLWVALGIGTALLLTIPLFAMATDQRPAMYPGWPALLPGLFAQGGVAEETVFRGYLFGNLRRTHSFWKAAWFSAGVFVAFGRFDEAENLLMEALRGAPDRADLKLQLLDVYLQADNSIAFDELAVAGRDTGGSGSGVTIGSRPESTRTAATRLTSRLHW